MPSIRTRSDSNKLMIDFRYQGQRYRKQSALIDSPNNRKKLIKQLRKINAEKELESLDISKFSRDDKAELNNIIQDSENFNIFSEQWIKEKKSNGKHLTPIKLKLFFEFTYYPFLRHVVLNILQRAIF